MPLENSQPSDDGFNTDAGIVCGAVGGYVGTVFGGIYGGTVGGTIGAAGMLAGPQIGVVTTVGGVMIGRSQGARLGGYVFGGAATYLCGEFVPEDGWWW